VARDVVRTFLTTPYGEERHGKRVAKISAIERGTNLPSIESLLAISKAFDKKPSEILQGIDF